jgi:phage baseplate assembly protein W
MSTSPWLGTGFPFPWRPDDEGRLTFVHGAQIVRQAIETILDTDPGERVMRPSFGCGLLRYLMAPNTPATRVLIGQDIEEALKDWEPRIRVTSVTVEPDDDPSLVWISISYADVMDLRPANLVYPFYLRG